MYNPFKKKAKTETEAPIVNKDIGPDEAKLILNSINDLRSRLSQAVGGGYDFADTLHNIFLDFGYPESLTFSNFWNMYRRFGIAKTVIEYPPDVTWMRPPVVESENDQFIKEFGLLVEQISLWSRMHAIDKRQRVGTYAGMFMRVRDNKSPEQPIDSKLNGVGSIMQIMPLYEGQLKVIETHSDPKEDNYNLPKMYEYNESGTGSRNSANSNTFKIHPDRIVIVSEDADNGGIYGTSSLEAPYNSLMDLRKILGGGGEGFYKNSAQNIVFELKDAASAAGNKELLSQFNENYDEFSRNRHRRSIWTPGLEAKALESNLINPKDFFFNSLYDVAASSKIPATIIIGQQTGRLASSEDSRSFLSSINSRRDIFGTESTKAMIDWCIKHGILPSALYELVWEDLLALSKKEQLENADQMATINDKLFKSGQEVAFKSEEIRETAGFEEIEDIEPGDEDIEEDLDE